MADQKAFLLGHKGEIQIVAGVGQNGGNSNLNGNDQQQHPGLLVNKMTGMDNRDVHDAQEQMCNEVGGNKTQSEGVDDGLALFLTNVKATVDTGGQHIGEKKGQHGDGGGTAGA